MTLRELYERAVALGMEHDPRGREAVQRALQERQKQYEAMKEQQRRFFDPEALRNPYSDTRILSGTGQEELQSILVGIDVEVQELLLAEALRARGQRVDAVLAHHPEGRAYANLYQVMGMQADILNRFGVPINVAEDLLEGRTKEVERKLMPVNHTRAVDAARLLGIPFLCLHTVADNMVSTYLQRLFEQKAPYSLADVLELLLEIPEYQEAARVGAGPKLLVGSETRKAGKIFVDMTGGTEGSKEIFQSMAASGISTVVAMHLSEEHRKEAEKNHVNVVIAGHIASDNLGLNLLLDGILKEAPLQVLECSGFRRISRA
jgi:putative NIF3 family GTP cyclohydrolase 1 type 2